ncbi:MAG: triose-phosphate isomerase [Candidatus Terraquivivens tikiterensis]|uniref:Triosephosphate isomerase n=1 Tax=Candidatus Terraquivivens tikiterensis TaxID=1980982 RepID=A0A2R7Y118_9ARCH|nr:MAG: triose-phosphate isomerase [Candidatus Terraquivivens tikiterensis]
MLKRLNFPAIVINFKTYVESLGDRGMKIAKGAERVSNETGVCICVAPQFTDLRIIASSVSIPVLAQHVDPYPPGSYTGSVSVEALKDAGVAGSILNHSEKKLQLASISAAVKMLRDAGMFSLVCADDVDSAMAVAALNPTALAVEPPELIGTGIPVSRAKPEIVSESVRRVRSINREVKVLCGAGITTGEDVSRAIVLGSDGVLLASGVVKAKDPEAVMRDMAKAVLSLR